MIGTLVDDELVLGGSEGAKLGSIREEKNEIESYCFCRPFLALPAVSIGILDCTALA